MQLRLLRRIFVMVAAGLPAIAYGQISSGTGITSGAGVTPGAGVTADIAQAQAADNATAQDARDALKQQLTDEIAAAKMIDAGADPKAYLALYEKAFLTAAKIYPEPHPELEIIRGEIGFAHFMLGNADKALATLEHSIPIFEASLPQYEDKVFEAYNNLAVVYGLIGNHKNARVYIVKAVEKWQEKAGADGSIDLAQGFSNLAMTDRALGNFDQALESNQKSIVMLEGLLKTDPKAADPLVVALGNLPLHQGDIGDFGAALASTRRLVGRLDSLLPAEHPRAAYILLSASKLMLDNQKILESEALARRALTIRENAMGAESPAAANARLNLITVLLAQENFDEALALSQYSYKILEAAQGQTADDVFELRSKIAMAKFGQGDQQAAIDDQATLLEEQIIAFPAGNDEISKNREVLATMLAKAGKWQDAQAVLTQLQQSRSGDVGDKQRHYLTFEALLALSEIKNGHQAKGLQRLETVRAGLDGFWQSEIFREGNTGAANSGMKRGYGWAVAAAIAADNPELAFSFAQRFGFGAADRAALRAALRDMTNDPQATSALRARQDMVEARSLALDDFYRKTASGDTKSANQIAQKINMLTQKIDQQNRVSHTTIASDNAPVRLNYAVGDITALLAQDEALIMTLETDFGPKVIAMSKTDLAIADASLSSQDVNNLVADIRHQIDDHELTKAPFDRSATARLYSGLFSPKIAAVWAGKRLVNIISRGNMAKVPFAMLTETSPNIQGSTDQPAERWMIEKFALAYPVGISGFMADRTHSGNAMLTDFFGIGAPLGDNLQPLAAAEQPANIAYRGPDNIRKLSALPALDYARDELEKIADAVAAKRKTLLTGAAATEAAVRALDFSKAKIITFATHGLMAGELDGVDEATLILSAPTGPALDANDDGLLTASEISRLSLDAEWVVLSACNSASGERSNDDSLSGLAQAFLYAGTDSLLVSHWRLRDDIAAQLTVDTFKNVSAGMPKAEALRQAQLRLMADQSVPNSAHPAAWAPFVLIGQ